MRTERLILRRPQVDDLADYLAFRNAPTNLAHQPIKVMPEADARAFLERQTLVDPALHAGWVSFAVQTISEPRVIGEVGMYCEPSGTQVDVGWSFHADVQGRGYATEAASALLDFLFEVRQMRRITAKCDPENLASRRLMERLGMRQEAHFRKSFLFEDVWRDECHYALLRDEWEANRSSS